MLCSVLDNFDQQKKAMNNNCEVSEILKFKFDCHFLLMLYPF